MLARPSVLFLVALALAAPARAEPSPAPSGEPVAAAELGLSKLRALLFDRGPEMPLRAPGSPRYLALEHASARGTRAFVGWVLPGLTASELPDLRAVTDALAAALRDRARKSEVPFDAAVSLDMDGEAPLIVVELSSNRLAATRELEQALLEAVLGLNETQGRVAAVARAKLGPLARAVVEVHRPDVPPVVRAFSLPKVYVVQQGDDLAKVARHFRITEKALVEANRLETRQIRKGQKLVLPR
jgi:hypothetical protein